MELYEYGTRQADTVLIQPVEARDLAGIGHEAALIGELTKTPFRLIAVGVENWNDALSPWPAPAVFGKQDFGGRAAETLAAVLPLCREAGKRYIIGGYSLAGLFALWAAYETDVFRGVAAASPSLWYPGFAAYMRARRPHADAVYLSLGDREEKTKNPVMATVGHRVREARDLLTQAGLCCTLVWNEGNHFMNAERRTAGAFAWLLQQGL